MDLQSVLRDVRRNVLVAVAAFLVCLAAGAAGALLPAKQYDATTTVLVQPTPGNSDPLGAIAIIQYLVPQLPTEATSAKTLQAARSLVPASYAAESVKITSSSPAGTSVLVISATSTDPQVSAAYATAVEAQVQALQPKGVLYEFLDLSPAVRPGAPSNPSTADHRGGSRVRDHLGRVRRTRRRQHQTATEPCHRDQRAHRGERAGEIPRLQPGPSARRSCSSRAANRWPWRPSKSSAATCS